VVGNSSARRTVSRQAGRVIDEVEVRRAEPGDARDVADVYLRSRHASVPAIPPSVHDDDDVRHYFATVMLPEREVWVLEAGAAGIVGLLVLHDDWVDHLYLDPGWTGRGHGTRLLDLAKERRPARLDLWAFQSNLGARRFYERHGFAAVRMTDGDNEEGAPDVHYRWPGLP
jgi:GNAT superfamily N-acetyltransferase